MFSSRRPSRPSTAYAGRQPFETWIVPRSHGSQFELISPADADELGDMLWTILRKLDAALEGPPFNLIFHSAPFHEAAACRTTTGTSKWCRE